MNGRNVRRCPVKGCVVVVQSRLLMCPEHWRLVPKKLQSEVRRWYRRGQEKSGNRSTMYVEAAAKAVAAAESEERLLAAAGNQIQQSLL